jgi:hypothetical protein
MTTNNTRRAKRNNKSKTKRRMTTRHNNNRSRRNNSNTMNTSNTNLPLNRMVRLVDEIRMLSNNPKVISKLLELKNLMRQNKNSTRRNTLSGGTPPPPVPPPRLLPREVELQLTEEQLEAEIQKLRVEIDTDITEANKIIKQMQTEGEKLSNGSLYNVPKSENLANLIKFTGKADELINDRTLSSEPRKEEFKLLKEASNNLKEAIDNMPSKYKTLPPLPPKQSVQVNYNNQYVTQNEQKEAGSTIESQKVYSTG